MDNLQFFGQDKGMRVNEIEIPSQRLDINDIKFRPFTAKNSLNHSMRRSTNLPIHKFKPSSIRGVLFDPDEAKELDRVSRSYVF